MHPPAPSFDVVRRLVRATLPAPITQGGPKISILVKTPLNHQWPPEGAGVVTITVDHSGGGEEAVRQPYKALAWHSPDGGWTLTVSVPDLAAPAISIQDEVNEHPEWTDREVLAACHNAGAQYCPDAKQDAQKVVARLTAALAQEFGAVQVTDLKSAGRPPSGADGEVRPSRFMWDVWLVFKKPAEFSWCSVALEPFEARVFLISCRGTQRGR
ncbi:MAG: hypothetical protein JNM38_22735 [Acidobacteria bacterium]|nr:hypothetical protein [Acidobacteriota bacterium]